MRSHNSKQQPSILLHRKSEGRLGQPWDHHLHFYVSPSQYLKELAQLKSVQTSLSTTSFNSLQCLTFYSQMTTFLHIVTMVSFNVENKQVLKADVFQNVLIYKVSQLCSFFFLLPLSQNQVREKARDALNRIVRKKTWHKQMMPFIEVKFM